MSKQSADQTFLGLARTMAAVVSAVVVIICLLGLASTSPSSPGLRTVVVLAVSGIALVVLVRPEFARLLGPTASVNKTVQSEPRHFRVDQRQR